jgi:hypothetical protein
MPTLSFNASAVPVTLPAMLSNSCVTPAIWNELCNSLTRAKNDACCTACAAEWCCCLMTGCWCIFCCHVAVEGQFYNPKADEACSKINSVYFQGQHVFTGISGHITVVTENFHSNNVHQHAPAGYAQAVAQPYAVAQPAQSSQYAPLNATEKVGQQQMEVTVPENIYPGATMQVQAPTGQVISVTVPPGIYPGQTITVAY